MTVREKKNFAPRVWTVMSMLACLLALLPPWTAAQTVGGFSIRAVLPENQVDKRQTYFDLRMSPGQEQTLEVVITNTRKEPLEARVELNPATTGRNGLILYSIAEAGQSDIRDLATLNQSKVTVPAEGTYTVSIDLKIPHEPIEGVVLGGITVSEEAQESAPGTGGVSVRNAIAYVVALKVTQQDALPEPDFSLVSVGPALMDYRTAVVARLRNESPRIVKDMKINAQVYQTGAAAPLHTLTLDSADMAPATDGDFVIDWAGEPLRRGRYRLRMTATYEGQTWEWDEEFDIGGEASDINDGAVGLKRDYTWLYVAGVLALIVLIWIIAYRRGKKERKAE